MGFIKEDMLTSLYEPSDMYLALRQAVFDLPCKGVIPTSNGVFAFVMEVGSDDATFCYSLVSVADGAASIYFSNGGGFIGAEEHEGVSKISKELLYYAKGFEEFLDKRDDYPLPSPAMIRFYLIMKGGVLSSEFPDDVLASGESPLSDLFYKANDLITAIRLGSNGIEVS
jgi:hypothetical protein